MVEGGRVEGPRESITEKEAERTIRQLTSGKAQLVDDQSFVQLVRPG